MTTAFPPMADLLECLLQIKGLRETARRVEALVRRPEVANALEQGCAVRIGELLARLADIERRHGRWLRAMIESDNPLLAQPAEPGPEQHRTSPEYHLNRFLERRADNLRELDRCSAQDLSRKGVRPDGSTVIVADPPPNVPVAL